MSVSEYLKLLGIRPNRNCVVFPTPTSHMTCVAAWLSVFGCVFLQCVLEFGKVLMGHEVSLDCIAWMKHITDMTSRYSEFNNAYISAYFNA